jgi:beta-galactosidase/beta-glucuronidase
MIRVHRNHPSIIAWSTGNEDFFSQKQTLPQVRVLLSKEVAFAHELDPTRPVGIGGCQRGNIDKLGDIAGYNGDGARLFIDPGIPSIVTEYGSTTAVRPGNYDPGWGDLNTANGQDKSQPYPWRYPWRSGEAIWCGFDRLLSHPQASLLLVPK